MSDKGKHSAIEKFKNVCRNEFSYLLTKFGFREDNAKLGEFENEFQIRFIRHDLTVVIEGIHHGSSTMVYIQDIKHRQIFPMLLKPDFQPARNKKTKPKLIGQAEEIKVEAQLLLQYGNELLKGDFSEFERAFEKKGKAWAGNESRRQFGVAVQEAVDAFRNQDWSKVVESLESYEEKISVKMAKKLKTARENLLSKDKDE